MPSLPTQETLLGAADECEKMTQFLSGLPPGYRQLCVWYLYDPEFINLTNEALQQQRPMVETSLSEMLSLSKPPVMVYSTPKFSGETGGFECTQVYFLLHDDDIQRDDVCHTRFQLGIRWWEDELGNDRHELHPQTILRVFPSTWPGGKRGCDPDTLEALAALPTSL